MLIHLPTPDSQNLGLRARLLDRALRAHLHRRGDVLLPATPCQTGPEAVTTTALYAAMPPRPHAPKQAALGLGLPQALHDGPATLLLTQPLCTALETFGGPDPRVWATAGTVPLVLQGYARAIVLDRADLAGTAGFAPWLPLALADGFPVDAPRPALGSGAQTRILILDHGAPAGQAEVLHRALRLRNLPITCLTQDSPADMEETALSAALHLHLGFGPARPVTAFSPTDSLLSGAYTLVLPAQGYGAGKALRTLCTARSYGDLAPTLSELEARAHVMLDRLETIRQSHQSAKDPRAQPGQNRAPNPELARFGTLNAEARTEALKRFDALLDTAHPTQEAA